MGSTSERVRLCGAVLVWIGFLPIAYSSADEEFSVTKLVSAWKERERAFDDFRVSWRASVVMPLTPNDINPDPVIAKKGPRLNEPRAENKPASLTRSGDKYRYVTVGFHTRQGVATSVSVVSAGDSRIFYNVRDGLAGTPASGIIADRHPSSIDDTGALIGLNILFRPFASGILSEKEPPIVNGAPITLEGRLCIWVIFPHARYQEVTVKILVDQGTQVPLRVEMLREQQVETTTTLKYVNEPGPESLSAWEGVIFSYGRVLQADWATDVNVERAYKPAAVDFVVDFPVGAHVVDKRGGKEIHLRAKGNGEFEPWRPGGAK